MKKALKSKHVIAMTLVGTVLVSAAAISHAGPFGGHHNHHNPLEKMLDSVDLTDQQETEAQRILDALPAKPHQRGGMMKELLVLDPDDADYLDQAEKSARKAGEQVTERINAMAKARKDIYSILTPEQKAEIDKRIQKKLKRMEKHRQYDED